jgi:thiamine-monophosphate kinase
VRLADVGEFGLLAALERLGLVRGIEHDVAVLEGGVVATQDALVEGVHFRLDWASWRDVGYKAAAVNLSDLAAAGADPEGLLVTLAAPAVTRLDDVVELYAGLNEAGTPVVGGDTTSAERVSLTVTAVGRSARVPGRAGARPGDVLVVTGPLGASAAGYLALEDGTGGDVERAHLRPPFRLEAGRRLAVHAHAMLDLSDGLAADAAHLARRSGCRVVIELERVPLAPAAREAAERRGLPVWDVACGFGEDYELLAALTRDDARALGLEPIGDCVEGSGVELLAGGEAVGVAGWDHFRTR